jgi:salicylate hydroxylase
VAGAGIGGLTAALTLARAGWRVTVLERAPAIEEVGAGIQIPPNACRVLERYGLLHRIRREAGAPEYLIMRRARDGSELIRVPLGAIADLRWKAPYLVIHRADLQAALLDFVAREPAIAVKTGAAALGFASSDKGVQVGGRMGRINVRFDGDLLVAADGLRSALRGRMGFGPGDAPVYSGRTAWRALVPAEAAPPQALRLASSLWLGPRAHLVHYPVRAGRLVNLVAIVEDAWRGAEGEDIWAVPGEPAEMRRRFARWRAEARDLIEAATEWRRWPLFDRNPVSRWSVERAVLLGDAAHPVLPFLAQGAALAIEDAAALGDAAARRGGDIRAIIADYERARIRRAALVNTASRRQGGVYHLAGPLALARDLALRSLGPERLMQRLDWLYLP